MTRINLVVASLNWTWILVGCLIGVAYLAPKVIADLLDRHQLKARSERLAEMAARLYEAQSEPRWQR